ncbi:monocarboxylate transporter 10-like [Cloeon dipterum]|uniref:monocarboxylate transporter 10-like n=1 Tax=Cloeon dipterum TaxID=197152 RepID=UPI003220809D
MPVCSGFCWFFWKIKATIKQQAIVMETSAGSSEVLQTQSPWTPAEGGFKGWLTVAASFIIQGLVLGINLSYSVIYVELQRILDKDGVTETSYKTSLVGSLSLGTTFAFSILAGILNDLFSYRTTTIIGGCFCLVGMFSSSFLIHYVEALYFTYGILFGTGAALCFNPSIAVLGLHFKKRIGLVCGIVSAGVSVFNFWLPPALEAMISAIGLDWTLRVVSFLMILIIVAAFTFNVPDGAKVEGNEGKKFELSKFLNKENWKKKKFVIWTICIPIALFGYFVPFVHMVKFVNVSFPSDDGKIPLMCIGIASAVGRLAFGFFSDYGKINRVMLQQIALFSIGVLTMLLAAANAWVYIILITLGIGVFDGCFFSMLGPVAFDLCGPKGASQAIGFVNGLSAFSVTLGPTIAGKLFEMYSSYTVPFLVAGAPLILGAFGLFAIMCVSKSKHSEAKNVA